MLSPNLQYHIGHVLRDKTFSSPLLILATSQHFPPLKYLLAVDHFKYEGSTQLGKSQSLVFSREDIAIYVGRVPEVVSKFVLQRLRVLHGLRD